MSELHPSPGLVLGPCVHLLVFPMQALADSMARAMARAMAPQDPAAVERAAAEVIRGRALQLLDLDFHNPMAFEQAQRYLEDALHAATEALEARGEYEVAQQNTPLPWEASA
jgi:hypothetical protein